MTPSRFVPWLFISLLGTSLLIASPALADSSDWLQVKRFRDVMNEAQKGRVQAMYEVGRKYERGRGTGRNLQKAAEWYQKAAEANYTPAMARLGILYVEGNGVEQDLDKALRLLGRAAEENIPGAQYQLASMYELGIGVEQDIKQAISWYRKAFDGGYYRADDKVRQLRAQLEGEARTPDTPRTAKQTADRSSTRTNTLTSLLQGSWQRNGRPAGYLPSSISQCRRQNNVIRCISTAQERSTGSQTITYNTEAVLSNFDGERFEITYSNNVLEISRENTSTASAFEEETTQAAPAAVQQASDQQNFSHQLECRLETPANPRRIHCTKDRIRTLQFFNN